MAERARIQAFQKYDMDVSGKMNFSELKSMLTDLNQGEVPEDAEVQVLERGPILMRNQLCLVGVTANGHVPPVEAGSSCCSVQMKRTVK